MPASVVELFLVVVAVGSLSGSTLPHLPLPYFFPFHRTSWLPVVWANLLLVVVQAGAAPNRWGLGSSEAAALQGSTSNNGDSSSSSSVSAENGADTTTTTTNNANTKGSESVVSSSGVTPSSALAPAPRKLHPLYMSVALALLVEVINSRLFTTVRDMLGLTYDVSFQLSNFDRLKVSVTRQQHVHDNNMCMAMRSTVCW